MAASTYSDIFNSDSTVYNYATHYSYDVHGNVQTLWQDNPSLTNMAQRFKRIDYDYDLVSGKVNDVYYQHDSLDAFSHHYEYDADNRITQVYTSKYPYAVWTGEQGDQMWDNDAKYFYYKHGPLARVELGDEQVQGIDYAYTLQGWLKGVNSETLDSTRDMGQDGNPGISNLNSNFAKDAFGYSLSYYDGDYAAIATNANNFMADKTNLTNFATDAPGLYNGNISSMVTTITNPATGKALPQLTAYRYDQLNRIRQMKAFDSINFATNAWVGTNYIGKYFNSFTYDANGNIEKATAKNKAGVAYDKQTYHYQKANGNKISNRLYAINDSATVTSGNDLLNQISFDSTSTTMNTVNNYSYDEIGELKANKQDSITDIEWTVFGKIKSVTRIPGCHKYNLKFDYDASNKRIAKNVYTSNNTYLYSEYYVRDAQGNILSAYKFSINDTTMLASFKQKELHLYGNTEFGIDKEETELISPISQPSLFTHSLGDKEYTGSNHLGNDLVIFSDIKEQHTTDGLNVDYYKADIVGANDYAPFGGLLTERTFNKGIYPNSFNNKRDDPEMGDWQDYGMRMYSPWRRGFPTPDPLFKSYPELSSYQFASNRPIEGIDLDGKEYFYTSDGAYIGNLGASTEVFVINNNITASDAKKNIELANNLGFTSEQVLASKYLKKYSTDFGITNKQLNAFASVIHNESGGDKTESYAIGNATMNFLDEGGSTDLKTLDDVTMYSNSFAYGATQSNYTDFNNMSEEDKNSKFAVGAALNAIGFSKKIKGFGLKDYSNNADDWDAKDVFTNSKSKYIWSNSSKGVLKTFHDASGSKVNILNWKYKETGFQIKAIASYGKSLFEKVIGVRGESKKSPEEFK